VGRHLPLRRLRLSPREGFVFRSGSGLGETHDNVGAVSEDDGVLVLEWEWPNPRFASDAEIRSCPEPLQPILWGERRYLAGSVPFFCSEVNSGAEPRQRVSGAVLLCLGDERLPARGKPRVPAEFDACLLDTPLEARVLSD